MQNLTRRTLATSTLALIVAGCGRSNSTAAAPTTPQIGTFGVDLTARDLNVKPGDDFNNFCNGTWLRTKEIPADRVSWGAFDELQDKSEVDTLALLQDIARRGGQRGSNEQKLADFFNAYLDTAGITQKGMTPIAADLAAIAAAQTIQDIVTIAARPDIFGTFPIALAIDLDAKDPDKYAVLVTHRGLGLPDREYYRRSDGQFPQIRQQYRDHIARQLGLAGQSDGAAKAQAILALETQIAERHWTIERRRDVTATYNKKTRAELIALNPAYPWEAALHAAGLDAAQNIIVRQLSAMAPLSRLVMSTPVDTWKAYLTYHCIRANAAVLPTPIDNENFAFFGHTLNGQPQQRERARRAIYATNGALAEALGPFYVARHFTPTAKTQMDALVENMRRAYGARIDQITWMSAATKTAAHEKLRTFRPKIGYPTRWRDYSAYEVRAGDAFGNNKRAAVFDWNRQASRINQRTDKDEWDITVIEVNAYYNPTWNEIVFPAAILQAPFFDPNADPGVNYGSVGAVIGHEMGHGFDDQGAKSDAQGVLRDWWSPADVRAFTALGDRLAAQYNTFTPFPGIHVNGRLTLGENIGDNGGLQVAHEAYKISLNGQPAPEIEGFTGDQRFFMGYGQIWREKLRDEAMRNQILSDPHAPGRYRINGAVHNLDEWYAAFNVQPGEALYLAPADRVQIW